MILHIPPMNVLPVALIVKLISVAAVIAVVSEASSGLMIGACIVLDLRGCEKR